MNQFRIQKCALRRAFGTLMLALPLCGLAVQLSPAQAQPAPNSANDSSPLAPDEKVKAGNVMSVARNEQICKNALDIKLENATIEQLAAQIKATFPGQQIVIQQRDARPVRVSIDLKETTVGTLLQAVATLASCQLWVLPDQLLIAPPGKLPKAEQTFVEQGLGGAWADNREAGGTKWSSSMTGQQSFVKAIVAEAVESKMKADANGTIKATLGDFSPDSRAMLQQIANWQRGNTLKSTPNLRPFVFGPDSPIEIDVSDPKILSLKINDGGASEPNASAIALRYLLEPNTDFKVISTQSYRYQVADPVK